MALGLAGAVLLLSLVPPLVVWKICAAISRTFAKCPYCGRVFVSRAGRLSILGMLRFR
jgi:hypothetical protein